MFEFVVHQWAACAPELTTHAHWLTWAASPTLPVITTLAPALTPIPSMVRRRLNALGRVSLQSACDAQGNAGPMPLVTGSRHGDLQRSFQLLQSLANHEPLSPTDFSLSVANAIAGVYSIARYAEMEVAPTYSSVAAGRSTAEAAVVEAACMLQDGAPEVLVLVYDAPLPAAYVSFSDEANCLFAWSWHLRARKPQEPVYYSLEALPRAATPILTIATRADIEVTDCPQPWKCCAFFCVKKRSWCTAIRALPGAGNAMLDSAARAWRVVSAALCFVGFGAGGLFLRGVIFPLLALLIRQPQARAYRAKEIVHAAFRLLVFTLQVLGVLRLEVRGRDRLRADGLLIVANHPSLLDVVFLIALVRHGDCLVKSKLRDNPFTAGAVRAAGYICNDQGLDVIAQCVASVRDARNSLIIFPEGTRSTEYEESQTLRRGAAHVAIAGRIDITPVVIDCHPPFLARGQKWHKAAARRPHIVIDVRPTLTVRPFLRANMPDPIAARHLTAHLTKYFAEERSYVRAGRRDQTAHYQHPGA